MSDGYNVIPHGPHWLLVVQATGAGQLFVGKEDAHREGQRLVERLRHPPIAWVRQGALAPGEYPLPLGAQPVACASCGARIVWTRADTAPIPLSLATARTLGGRRVATTHFADCPEAREWQRGDRYDLRG